jgi:hypothetical protein
MSDSPEEHTFLILRISATDNLPESSPAVINELKRLFKITDDKNNIYSYDENIYNIANSKFVDIITMPKLFKGTFDKLKNHLRTMYRVRRPEIYDEPLQKFKNESTKSMSIKIREVNARRFENAGGIINNDDMDRGDILHIYILENLTPYTGNVGGTEGGGKRKARKTRKTRRS